MVTTLYANGRYWYVTVEEHYRDKIGTISQKDLHCCVRVFFGPEKTHGSIRRITDVMRSSDKQHFALVYLEDIILFSESLKKQISHVHIVLLFF